MTTKCDYGMNLEAKKTSRVHQLRDLFQMGTPRPAEELEQIEFSRPRSKTDPSQYEPAAAENEAPHENSISSKSSTSNLSIDSIPAKRNDILSEMELDNPAWVVRKQRTTSESDLVTFNDSHPTDEFKDTQPSSAGYRKHNYEFNVSIMCPMVPFVGNQPPKIRSLGKEFEARRLSKNLTDESNTTGTRSANITPKDDDSEKPTPPSLSKLPSLTESTDNRKNGHNINPSESPSTDDYFDPLSNLESVDTDKIISVKGGFSDTDSDSDVDKSNDFRIASPKSPNQEEDSYEDLIEEYKSELARINQIDCESEIVSESDQLQCASLANIDITSPPTVIPNHLRDNTDFQDYFLESDNFKIQNPMNAETVDLEDKTSSSEDDGSQLGLMIGKDMAIDVNRESPSTDFIPHELICPSPPQVVAIEDGCHIMEDGHFFYEKTVDIDIENETDMECGTEKLFENQPVKTFKRPGAKVHFVLEKVRIYSTYTPSEYNRKNEEIDPLSASAEYEMEKRLEKMIIFPVDLYKGSKGLGISILGMGVGHNVGLQKLGIFVKSIIPGGAAEEDGRIQVYDQIVEVDGQSLVCISQEFAASVLRNTHGVVNFSIGREIDQTNSEIVKLVERSRQNSGLSSNSDILSPAPLAQMDEISKAAKQSTANPSLHTNILDSTTFSLNPESQTEDDENLESEGFGMSSVINQKFVGVCTVSTQTIRSGDPISSNEKFLKDQISNLESQLLSARINEEKLHKNIFELKDKVEETEILKDELALLSKNYGELLSEVQPKQTEIMQSNQHLETLVEENSSLKEKLEETTKKYKKLKRFLKASELRDEKQKHIDMEQSKALEYNEQKIKSLESQVAILKAKLSAFSSMEEADMSSEYLSGHIYGNINSASINDLNSDIKMQTQLNESNYESLSSSDMDESVTELSKNVEISSRVPKKPENEKTSADYNINASNNLSDHSYDIFEELTSAINILDNQSAKSKAELRKSGPMAHRKPPTKSMMIGDASNSPLESDSKRVTVTPSADKFYVSPSTEQTNTSNADRFKFEDNDNHEIEAPNNKSTSSKVVGGFPLPGKNEIKTAIGKKLALKKNTKPSGIKPSNVSGLKKAGKMTKSTSDDERSPLPKFGTSKTKEISSKSNPNRKDQVILTSAKSIDNDAIFERPTLNVYSPSYLPNDSSNKDSYTLKKVNSDNDIFKYPVSEWDKERVVNWLNSISLSHLENTLISNGITSGYKLIRLDSDTIKKIGVSNSNDRLVLKRKIKELRQINTGSLKSAAQPGAVSNTTSNNIKSKM